MLLSTWFYTLNTFFFYFAESQYKVKTKWIAADFAKGREVYDQIEKELAGIDVGILGK